MKVKIGSSHHNPGAVGWCDITDFKLFFHIWAIVAR